MKRLSVLPLLGVLLLSACKDSGWEFSPKVRALDRDVAIALGDTARGWTEGVSAEDIPLVAPPGALRPCCAFGTGLQVKLGAVPVPGVSLSNIVGPQDLGPHRFNAGMLTVDPTDDRGWADSENNGLVYTCRGGFIDMAHVRDNADLTLSLATQVARHMDEGGVFELPPQGATIRVRVGKVDPAKLQHYGRRDIAVAAAEWIAFNESIWHEIATWYGYASLANWPEKISAYSPEDLYSNILGIKLAAGIIQDRGASSDFDFDRNLDAWIRRALIRLEAVDEASGKQAMHSVDGIWWDSSKRIPDWTLVQRRHSDFGSRIRPWVVSDATGWDPKSYTDCGEEKDVLVLRHADGFHGVAFRDHITIEWEVHDDLIAQGFPLNEDGSRVITQEDLMRVTEVIRKANAEELGPEANEP